MKIVFRKMFDTGNLEVTLGKSKIII